MEKKFNFRPKVTIRLMSLAAGCYNIAPPFLCVRCESGDPNNLQVVVHFRFRQHNFRGKPYLELSVPYLNREIVWQSGAYGGREVQHFNLLF